MKNEYNYPLKLLLLIEKNWKVSLSMGVLVFFYPELISLFVEGGDFPLFDNLISYTVPVFRIIGLSLITYSGYLKVQHYEKNKNKNKNNQ